MKQAWLYGALFTFSFLLSSPSYGRGGVIGGGSTGGGLNQIAPSHPSHWSYDSENRPYVPTKGLARCKEGRIEYALKFGPNGNPFAKDLICRNGRMVPLD